MRKASIRDDGFSRTTEFEKRIGFRLATWLGIDFRTSLRILKRSLRCFDDRERVPIRSLSVGVGLYLYKDDLADDKKFQEMLAS